MTNNLLVAEHSSTLTYLVSIYFLEQHSAYGSINFALNQQQLTVLLLLNAKYFAFLFN